MAEEMKTQIWSCDECKTRGEVNYGKDETDVMSVAYKLRDHHRTNSPDCTAADIRVLNKAAATEADIKKIMALRQVG